MSDPLQSLSPQALILGCGYLGCRLAGLLRARGVRVFATTRSPARTETLARLGAEPLLLDLLEQDSCANLHPALAAGPLDVFYLIPPGWGAGAQNARRLAAEALPRCLRVLERAPVGRAVLVSSSAVYGDCKGAWVNADTPAAAQDERGRALLETEARWLQSASRGRVLRLAGLYGPARVVGLQGLRDGTPVRGDPQAFLNLIRVEDAARLLLHMAASPGAAAIELGCDGSPVRRTQYYAWLAAACGLPAPSWEEARPLHLRGGGSRRCDNGPTCRRTGWAPEYPDFRTGLAGLLAGVDQAG